MSLKTRNILGIVLNVSGATFAGATMTSAFMHGIPWLLIFTVLFLGVMVSGILISRAVERDRKALYAEKYRQVFHYYAANPDKIN